MRGHLDDPPTAGLCGWYAGRGVAPLAPSPAYGGISVYHSLRAKIAESTAEPAAALLAEYYDGSSSEEEEVVAPRLMLTNGSEQPPAPNAFDPTGVWEYRVKCEGVIIVAEVGERPERLAFRRCHHQRHQCIVVRCGLLGSRS